MRAEVESLEFSSKEGQFREWCERERIKRFLFDLDDTICSTKEIFGRAIDRVCRLLAEQGGAWGEDKWKNEVKRINNRLFEEFGVNPCRWNLLVDELTKMYALEKAVGSALVAVFEEVYLTPLVFKEGAENGLRFIKSSGVSIGIVTHANSEWTKRKYNWLNLGRFVEWEEIFLVDENSHKTRESWLGAMRHFNLEPENCAVVGDSPRFDINPPRELGVRHCFLVEDRGLWDVHNQPIDSGVWRIKSLAEIPEVAFRKFSYKV